MMFRHPLAHMAAIAGVALAVGSAPRPAPAADTKITVFAAASLKDAFDEINAAFMQKTGVRIAASYAASPALMKQIEQGAPADVFISADLDWMDYGAQKKLMRDDTRVNLLGNRLVLIAPKDSKIDTVPISSGLDLAALAGDSRIVTGDVRAVPAGLYAKAALEKLGLWSSVQQKLAMVENVRVALALVARGEAPLGIVYATDAKAESKVKVIGMFPPESHPPIIYPAALTATAKPEAAPYLAFLQSAAAKAIFENRGFAFLAKPSS
jgi:molybdate transport system substrate-binding protein